MEGCEAVVDAEICTHRIVSSHLNIGEYGVIGWAIGDEELHPFELDEGRSGSDILLPHVDAHLFPTIL